MKSLKQSAQDYIRMRRLLGFKMRHEERRLRRFVSFMERQKATYIGVVSRNRRKFRHPARLSTSELVNALGKESERFVHILQCLGFCALRA